MLRKIIVGMIIFGRWNFGVERTNTIYVVA